MKFTEFDTDYVEYNGVRYDLNLAFPYVIQYFDIANESGLADFEKVELAIQLLVKDNAATDLDLSAKGQLLEIIFNEKINLREHKLAAKLFKHSKKSYDLDVDADRIQASFLMQYPGIDLNDRDICMSISWSEFNALLDGLREDTPFREAIKYRTMKLPEDATAEQRDNIRRMKTLYALSDGDDSGEETLEQQMAGMDMIQRVKFLAKLRKEQQNGGD